MIPKWRPIPSDFSRLERANTGRGTSSLAFVFQFSASVSENSGMHKCNKRRQICTLRPNAQWFAHAIFSVLESA